ncbi:MAG: Hsp20/alpha crystallin family protein [Deltaproteobacteria bacterium]|nr:Hsp20/alpha crystallin family protein [Deltaproteobacteria bacterium]
MARTKNMKEPSIPIELGGILNNLFGGFANRNTDDVAAQINYEPLIDIFSTDNCIIIEMELPGVKKEDIEISFMRSAITIKGIKYENYNDKKMKFVCMERSFGKFCSVVELTSPVDTAKLKAVYKDGVLKITLPKFSDRRGVQKKIPVE